MSAARVTPSEPAEVSGSLLPTIIPSERGVGRGSRVEARDLAPAILRNARLWMGFRGSQFQFPISDFRCL